MEESTFQKIIRGGRLIWALMCHSEKDGPWGGGRHRRKRKKYVRGASLLKGYGNFLFVLKGHSQG